MAAVMKELVRDPNVVSVPSQFFCEMFVTSNPVAHEGHHNNQWKFVAILI